MKKKSTRFLALILVVASLFATIYLNTVSTDLVDAKQPEIKVLPEDPPVEYILPEVHVVKTVLQKFIEL